MPDAYQLPNGLTIHQDSSQRWCDPTGFPLPITPDLADATPLWYSDQEPGSVVTSVPLTPEAKARKAKTRGKFRDQA